MTHDRDFVFGEGARHVAWNRDHPTTVAKHDFPCDPQFSALLRAAAMRSL
jgi:hypothetical protein